MNTLSILSNNEDPQDKENKDSSNNQSNLDSQFPSSPIVEINLDDAFNSTPTQSSELNSYIHMLSPIGKKKITYNAKFDRIISSKNSQQNLNNVIISNPYISSNIKTKMHTLIVENSRTVPQFKSLIYSNGNNNNIDSVLHKRKTKAKKNEILSMLNVPLNSAKEENKYNVTMRNKAGQIQKMLHELFNENIVQKNQTSNAYRTNRNINQIKKEKGDIEVNIFKNQFDIHSKVHKKYMHKKTNSCFC